MNMLTDEQRPIAEFDGPERLLVVYAYAGSGKTWTLLEFALKRPHVRMLYVSYNRGIRDEAARRFPKNVECMTSHQLAWSSFGKIYSHKLAKGNIRLMDISRALDIKDWKLVRHALNTVNKWLASASECLTEGHAIQCFNERELEKISPQRISVIKKTAEQVWSLMCDVEDSLPMPHDGYLKLYQLSKPAIDSRFQWILYDEAQDANPPSTEIVLSQTCKVIAVGDRHQQIYRFRGAENALGYFEQAGARRFNLTKSFRFGPKVAAVANVILRAKGEQVPVIGMGSEDFLFDEMPAKMIFGCTAIICRTVMGVLENAIAAAMSGKTVQFIGGKSSYNLQSLLDVFFLKNDRAHEIQDKRLKKDFPTWAAYEHHAEETKDNEMARAIKIVESYPDIPLTLATLESFIVGEQKGIEDYPDIQLMTAHKSKGLEFPDVILDDDFPDVLDPKMQPDIREDELNLLYVSVTRAIRNLVLNEIVKMLIKDAYTKKRAGNSVKNEG
ncbi:MULTISPECIES: UvrD-helicase domain-containing protein [Pseudomonas]|uniref:UvrD-helicase domain-containing protein n=1 Tax=Pseudomonas TaxID=286 RepID=UPI001866FE01|nr:UvrD-helicase domain-containing protein [Pseudomonas lundensis]